MKRILFALSCVVVWAVSAAAGAGPAEKVAVAPAAHPVEKLSAEDMKTLYAIGASVSRSLAVFTLSPAELDVVVKGIMESRAGIKPGFDVSAYTPKVQEFAKARRKAAGEKQAAAGREFLEKAGREEKAVKTTSGMVYIPLVEGKGEPPKASDTVKVNYRGSLIDGSEFDSSYRRGKPSELKLNGVIKCWTEGLQKMKPGGRSRLVCPAELAYGENGSGELILPGATLNFEVELLEVKAAPAAAEKK